MLLGVLTCRLVKGRPVCVIELGYLWLQGVVWQQQQQAAGRADKNGVPVGHEHTTMTLHDAGRNQRLRGVVMLGCRKHWHHPQLQVYNFVDDTHVQLRC